MIAHISFQIEPPLASFPLQGRDYRNFRNGRGQLLYRLECSCGAVLADDPPGPEPLPRLLVHRACLRCQESRPESAVEDVPHEAGS